MAFIRLLVYIKSVFRWFFSLFLGVMEMKLSEQIDYLKNELKSYVYLKQLIGEMIVERDNKLARILRKKEEVEEEINHNAPKSPTFGVISTSSYSNIDKPLSLVIKRDDLNEEYKEVQREYDHQIDVAKQRIRHVEECLKNINDEERNIIIGLYFERIGYNKMCDRHHYTRDGMYKKVNKIIKKMIKNH